MHGFSTTCAVKNLDHEISSAEQIFIGRIISNQIDSTIHYKIIPYKVWKGNISYSDTIEIFQPITTCHKHPLPLKQYVVFYIYGNLIPCCSSTGNFYNSYDVPILDQTFSSTLSTKPESQFLLDSLYHRRESEIITDLKTVDISGKNVVLYYNNKVILSRFDVPETDYRAHGVRYYLVEENTCTNSKKYDYVIYASSDIKFKGSAYDYEIIYPTLTEEKKKKLCRKIIRKASK